MPPPTSSPFLPALTVALGLPLSHRLIMADDTPSSRDKAASTLTPKSSSPTAAKQRAKNNVSRIYARRMMNRADLDQSHPWHNENGRDAPRPSPQRKDAKLLSETMLLSSLIDFKYPDQTFSAALLFPSGKATTQCESILSAKQRTLDSYNSLAPPDKQQTAAKPAEWNHDVDLHQRRLVFGKEISPLSDTTRLERWAMALRRMITLGCLAAPLGILLPVNWIVAEGDNVRVDADERREGEASSWKKYLSQKNMGLRPVGH